MEIKKRENEDTELKDIILLQDGKKLLIHFAGNLDLYMGIYTGNLIGLENISIDFDITKENYEIYLIFDNLYKEIISGRPFGFSDYVYDIDYKKYGEYKYLVDKNNNITWISDEGPDDISDKMIISKKDDDTYRLTFVRNEKDAPFYLKCVDGICVRFRNSRSRYKPFNASFMEMWQRLQYIDEDYHQIHMEELVYTKKLERKGE